MRDSEPLTILLDVYAEPKLARKDFGTFVTLVENNTISTSGVLLVSKDHSGDVHVTETHDHAVRNGVKRGARAGLILGLFAPPLLGATVTGGAAIGGLAGEIGRRRVTAGIGDKLGQALPAGLAGIVAISDRDDADTAVGALPNAVRTSSAPMDKESPTALKAGLKEAKAGLAG